MDESMRFSQGEGGVPDGPSDARATPVGDGSDEVAAELAALGPDPWAGEPWFEWFQQWTEENADQLADPHELIPEELVCESVHDAQEAARAGALLAGGLPDGYADRLDVLLEDVAENDVTLAIAAARRARAIDQARVWSEVSDEFVNRDAHLTAAERAEWARRVFVSEVAARLSLSQGAADALIHESRALVHGLPATLAALAEGRISYRHAQVIIDQAGTLPVQAWAAFEEDLLPGAGDVPAGVLRRRAVRARERLHPDSIVERTKAAAAKRRFVVEPACDGMAWLSLLLPAADAIAIHDRAARLAKTLQGPDETRTLAQLRADVARDLLLDGETTGSNDPNGPNGPDAPNRRTPELSRGIRPTVFVTVPALTLLGLSDEPATLDGYGPIDPETARRLAAAAPSFTRLLTHPETGVVLSMGTKKYKVPKDLKRWLQLRDQTCRRPGCTRPATHADIDHTTDWANGGPTDAANLAVLCEPCHRLKRLTAWKVRQAGGGTLEWTTPTGRVHTTEPAVRMRAANPPPPSSCTMGTCTNGHCKTAHLKLGPDAPPPF
jgi:hypothetical protein